MMEYLDAVAMFTSVLAPMLVPLLVRRAFGL